MKLRLFATAPPEAFLTAALSRTGCCRALPAGRCFFRDCCQTKCVYSKLVRAFIQGPGARLTSEANWLRRFYVGDASRFEKVRN